MIKFTTGNIFEHSHQVLVCPVNCEGKYGGLSYQFKIHFKYNFEYYQDLCMWDSMKLGEVRLSETYDALEPHYIILFPTTNLRKDKAKIGDIENGLYSLVQCIKDAGITNVAIPAIGCGHGRLKWAKVRYLIDKILGELTNVDITVYEAKE